MVADAELLSVKGVEEDALKRTVQVTPSGQGPFYRDTESVLFFAASQADEIEPWGRNIKMRDRQLREFIPIEPIFNSALGTVIARNSAFSWTIEGPPRKAQKFQRIFQSADFGKGWQHMIAKVSNDLYTQDSGAYIEVIRAGDSEEAEVVGLAHLDAARCYPTGIPDTPVVYLDRKGQYHTLKWFQVIQLLEMPSTYEGIPGLQYCALTRMFRAARIIRDIGIYIQEKVGGRNARAVTIVKGITPKQIDEAMEQARLKADSVGLLRFSQPIVIGAVDPKADIGFETLDIASLPDGFDLDMSYKQYVTQIAMAFLSDYQEFAPLPGGNLGTSSQSEILHLKNRGKGPGLFMKLVEQAINWTILPEDTEFKFDEQDAEADKTQAEVSSLRGTDRATRIASGELSVEAARQLAYDQGDLSEELLEMMKQQDAIEDATVTDSSPDDALDQLPDANNDILDEGGQAESQGTTPNEQTLEQEQKDIEMLNAGDDRAGPPKVADSRLRVESHVASVFEETFEELHKKLVSKVG